MRIAIFSDTFFPQVNGVAHVAHQSAEMLSARGHEVLICTAVSPSDLPIFRSVTSAKIALFPSIPSFVYTGLGLRLAIPYAPKTFKTIMDFRPDIIHTHTPFNVGSAAVNISRRLKTKLVGTHHTFYDHYLKHIYLDYAWAREWSWRRVSTYYNHCDLIISPSKALSEALKNHGVGPPITVMANAIDTSLFRPPTEKEKTVAREKYGERGFVAIYMGRLSYEKSIDQIIKAQKLVVEKDVTARLIIIGDGPERPAIEKLTKDLGLDKFITFTGLLRGNDLVEAMWTGDVFVTASKSENMPVSVLEGMSTGLPVIAVSEKGLPEIVEDNKNGILVNADDPIAFARAICGLIHNPSLRKVMTENSRARALLYSSTRIGEKLEMLYKTLLLQS